MLGYIGEAQLIASAIQQNFLYQQRTQLQYSISLSSKRRVAFNTEIDKELTPVNNAITLDQNVLQVDHGEPRM